MYSSASINKFEDYFLQNTANYAKAVTQLRLL